MSLIDGCKLSFTFNEKEYLAWRLKTSKIIRTWISVYEDTGEVKSEEDNGNGNWRLDRNKKYKWYTIVHSAVFQTYKVVIKEKNYETLVTGCKNKSFRGEISGSITSNYHGGENWMDLNFHQLQTELDKIEIELKLNIQKVKIDNLEPSITFKIDFSELSFFSVLEFLDKNVIAYKNKPFNRYGKNRKNKALGRYTELSDNTMFKIYDKSEEYGLPDSLMQFELRFKKMAVLKEYGICYLSDLRNWDKVNGLLSLLVTYFDRILIYDPSIDKNDLRLTKIQREMVSQGRSFEYWEDLKKESSNGTYYNRLVEFKNLSALYGNNLHEKIKNTFCHKWIELMGNPESCKNFPCVDNGIENQKLDVFTSTVGKNNLQLNNTNSRYHLFKYKTKKSVKVEKISRINKNKLIIENRTKYERQFKSFMNALSDTLIKLDKEAA